MPHEQFISEAIVPDPGTGDLAMMSRGEPGLPRGFTWRQRHYAIATLIDKWNTNSEGPGNVYVRRHWYRIRSECGSVMVLYCLRQALRGAKRWWLFAIEQPQAPQP